VEAQDAGSDVLQEEGGVFEREGNFSLGADSGLGSVVLLLVVVLDHKETLAKGASALLGQDSLDYGINTSRPYLMFLSLI